MSRSGHRLRLASSRVRAASLSSRDHDATTETSAADLDSGDDFLDPPPSRRNRSTSTPAQGSPPSSSLSNASQRVQRAVQRGLSVLNRDELQGELSDRFPFLNRGKRPSRSRGSMASKRRKNVTWRTVPCCLPGPSHCRIPNRAVLDGLCREGMGTLWFTKDEEPLELDMLSADELHYLIVNLYPMLQNVPYRLCRAGGPGHQVIVPLIIDEPAKIPANDQPFTHSSPYQC